MFSYADPQTTGSFSIQLADAGDLDGDGRSDLAWAKNNMVRIISTQNASVLRTWTMSGLGSNISLASLRDCDGDGVRDLAVGEPYVTAINDGRVTIYSGATGAVIRTLYDPLYPGNPPGLLGTVVLGADDLDGDTLTDVVVSAPSAPNGGKLVAYSGAWGSVLWSTPWSGGGDNVFGSALAPAGDLNVDGVPDVFVGSPGWYSPGRGVWVSGANGAVLSTVVGPSVIPGQFGKMVGGGYDINGNGVPDVAVLEPANYTTLFLYDGTGVQLGSYQAPPATGWPTRVMIAPDLNGDGYGEIIENRMALNPSYVRVWERLGAQPFGASGGTLSLSWTPGSAVPALGQLSVTGAAGLAAGAIGVSQSGQNPSGAPPALIHIALANLIVLQMLTFDATGAFGLPLDLRQPALAGAPFYLQAAELGLSGVTTTNGLQLLFGP